MYFRGICIADGNYAVFRYISLHQKLVASEFLKEILYFISYSLLGIGMSCLIFLPVLFNILLEKVICDRTTCCKNAKRFG